jgi:predicted nuclease of predicted toxin-antitoxin system
MNLSPAWVPVLERHGFKAAHWSTIGAKDASDLEIFRWARNNDHVVFTNDLDFGAILAVAGTATPSVFQVQTQNLSPSHLESLVVDALRQHESVLAEGALITLDESRLRVRILPLK